MIDRYTPSGRGASASPRSSCCRRSWRWRPSPGSWASRCAPARTCTRARSSPRALRPENFLDAWDQFGLGPLFLNSIVVTVASVAIAVVLSVLAAYGFARLRFRGSEVLFLLILLGLMIPPAALIIPLFVEIRTTGPVRQPRRPVAGLRRVRAAAVDPRPAQPSSRASPGSCWRRRASMAPRSAAILLRRRRAAGQGAHRDRRDPAVPVLLERLLPGARAAARRGQTYTLPVGIAQFIGQYSTPYELVAAAVLIAAVPVFILYLVLHRQFEQGVAEGAVKT